MNEVLRSEANERENLSHISLYFVSFGALFKMSKLNYIPAEINDFTNHMKCKV